MSRRMIHIRTWIFIPLVIVLLIFPVGIYVVFNITSQNYVQQMAENDLKKTLDVVFPIAEEVLASDMDDDDYASPDDMRTAQTAQAREFFIRVKSAFKQRNGGAQLIVTGRDGEITYPESSSVSNETRMVYEYFIGELKDDPDSIPIESIYQASVNEQEYIMYTMKIQVFNRNRYLIAFSALSDISDLLAATGKLILIITSFMAVFITIAVWLVSAGISKPIEKICRHTRQVSRGKLAHIENSGRIYEIAALTDELNDMSMRLKQYEDDQRAFYQNVAHELRTPLMSIRGYAEGIGCGAFQNNKEASQIIISQSIRLSDMAGELLLLSELENSGLNINMQSIEIVGYLQEQIKLMEGAAYSKNVSIKLIFDEIHDDTRIEADDELFAKAVTNIMANCIRYAKTEVAVKLKYISGMLAVIISDDGNGIQQEYLEHIFKRFYKGRDGNTGLGLAIAKAVVESMKGSVSAANGKNGGAEFTILIPFISQKSTAGTENQGTFRDRT